MKGKLSPRKKGVNTSPGHCPIAVAAECVADRWTILITRDLIPGPRRFSELQHSIVCDGTKKEINSRTLTNRLKDLEKNGILSRKVIPHAMPPHVEYALTRKGRDLSAVVEQIRKFGEKYFSS